MARPAKGSTKMLQKFAATIRAELESLVEQYDVRLAVRPGYDQLPELARRDLERQLLNMIADALTKGDSQELVEHVRQRAREWVAAGLDIAWFQESLSVPEEILVPLIDSVTASTFLWQALNRSQGAIWQLVADRAHANEEKLRAIYEGTNDAVMLLNEQGFFDCNPRTLDVFDFKTKEEFTAVHPADVSPPFQPDGQESLPAAQAHIQTAYQRGYDRFEWIHRRTSGEDFPAEVLLSAFDLDGQRVLQATVRDITERKQAEDQIERNLQETRVRFEVSQALAGQKTEDEVLVTLARQAGIYPQALVTFATFDRSGGETVAIARYAESFESGMAPTLPMGTRFPFSQFPLFRLLSADRPFVSQDTLADDRLDATSREITRETGAAGFAVFPITANNEWLGYMMVFAGTAGFFDEGKQRLYQTLVDQGALALQTARLRDQIQASLERRGAQVQTSTEVAQEIASATDLNELFKRVVTLIKERFDYYHAQIFRYEADQDAVVLLTGYGEAGQKMLAAQHKLKLGQGVVGSAAELGHSLLAADVTQDKDWHPNPYLPDTKSELAVPIKLHDQVLGILDIQADRAGALTDDDRLLVEGLCGQIAIAIENKQTEAALTHEQYLMDALMANATDTLYFKDIQSRFIRISQSQAARFGLTDPAEAIGKSDFDFFTDEHARPAFEDEQQIIRTGQPISKEEVETWPDRPDTFVLTTKLPLRDETGNIVGTFGISKDITERKLAGAALAEERNRLRILIDNLPVSVFIKDRDSRFTVNNAVHLRVLGAKSQEEVLGKRDFDFFPQELAAQYYADEQELMRIGEPLINHEEFVIDQTSGKRQWALSTKVPLRDIHGEVTGFLGFTQDITERKEAEETIRRSQVQLSEALRIAQMADWSYDVPTDTFTFNDQFYTLMRTTAEREGGYTMSSAQYAQRFVHPDDAALVGAEIGKALETPDPNYRGQVDHRIYYADGELGYITVRYYIEKDAQGRTIKTHGANQDITERQRSQEQLRLLTTAVEAAAAGIAITDRSGKIEWINPGFTRLTGYTLEEATGQNPRVLKSGKMSPEFYHDMWQAISTGQVWHGELINRHKDGTDYSEEMTITPVRLHGDEITHYIALKQDVTERKAAEETLRRSEAELAEALKIAKLAYWEYDVEKDLFLFNDQFFSIFHTTAEQHGGYQLSSAYYAQHFVYPDDLPIVGAEIEKALNSTDRHYSRSLEHRIQYADGSVGYISVSINIDRDEQGKILRYYGANQDITDRKLAEEAVRRSEARLSEALRIAQIGQLGI